MDRASAEVTWLLQEWSNGQEQALDRLVPQIHRELLIEQKQYTRALGEVRVAQQVLADHIAGVAEIRADVTNAAPRLASQKSRYDSDNRVESNWIAALGGEVALAQGRYDDAVASFRTAENRAWLTLNRDASTVFATNLPSRDGLARVEIARGNRAAAIKAKRALTAAR